MINVKIINSEELREIEKLNENNWRWLANGDCEVTFDDGAIGIVVTDLTDGKKMKETEQNPKEIKLVDPLQDWLSN